MIIYKTKKTEELHNRNQKRKIITIFSLLTVILFSLSITFLVLFLNKHSSYKPPKPDYSEQEAKIQLNEKNFIWNNFLSVPDKASPTSSADYQIFNNFLDNAQRFVKEPTIPNGTTIDPNDYKLFLPSQNNCINEVLSVNLDSQKNTINPVIPNHFDALFSFNIVLQFFSTNKTDASKPGSLSYYFEFDVSDVNLNDISLYAQSTKTINFTNIRILDSTNLPKVHYPWSDKEK